MSDYVDRKPGSKRRRLLKSRLAERDGAQCFYCATPFGPAPVFEGATLDHLVPRSQLHTWAQAALVLACGPCNEAKADIPPALLLRPETGRFGPGLVPLGGSTAQAPTRPGAPTRTRVDPHTRTRVREALALGQEPLAV